MTISKDSLTRDQIASIRHYCFNNIGEMYDRFHYALKMAKTTFYKILEGSPVRKDMVDNVVTLVNSLSLEHNANTKGQLITELIVRIEKYQESEKHADWLTIVQFTRNYKHILTQEYSANKIESTTV